MRLANLCLALLGLLAAAPAFAQDYVVQVCYPSYCINDERNPTLTLTRGQTYTFQVASTGHPFYIKDHDMNGTGSAYNNGVTNNGLQNGLLTFTVPNDAPALLFYHCSIHLSMAGRIQITNSTPGLTPIAAILLAGLSAFAGIWFLRRRPVA